MTKKISILWFFIHFALEVICFQFYVLYFGKAEIAALLAIIYDTFAFFPQFYIGAAAEKYPDFPVGMAGAVMVLAGGLGAFVNVWVIRTAGFLLLSLGNAFVHVGGAKATLFTCKDKISPASVFVSGGAFGVITGKLLGAAGKPFLIGFLIMAAAGVLVYFADKEFNAAEISLPRLDMADTRRDSTVVILFAFFVVSVRGLLGYGLPTAWNITPVRNFCLFCMMGVGKALGGILSDSLGAKKTALVSTGLSLPLLLLGDNIMWVSLAGIAMFSMTMAATLGILVSAVPKHPLMAYGLTTTGLLAGTLPVFFPSVRSFISHGSFLTVLTAVCFAALCYIMAPDKKKGR